ncbi:MAK10-like protein [Tanacetum coccineum]
MSPLYWDIDDDDNYVKALNRIKASPGFARKKARPQKDTNRIALNELQLHGDPAAVSLIQMLLSVNGNNLRVQNYEHLSPLVALKTLLDVLQTAELAIGVLTETTTVLAASLSLTDSTRIVEADGFMRVDLYNGWLFHLLGGNLSGSRHFVTSVASIYKTEQLCLGDLNKRRWIRDLCHMHMVNFLAILESKMSQVELWMLRQVWGNTLFDFASSSAQGMSGANWDGMLVMMGDFNDVRKASERYGSVFNDRQAKFFNEFINDASLIDISLGSFNYTWTDKCRLGERHNGPSTYSSKRIKSGLWPNSIVILSLLDGDGGISETYSYDLKKDHQKRLSSIDAKIEHDCASEEDFKNRRDSLTFLGVIDRMEAKDLAQKAKINLATSLMLPEIPEYAVLITKCKKNHLNYTFGMAMEISDQLNERPRRTAKLRNDILMFQQYQGESLSEAWTRFKDLLQKVPHHGIDLWLQDLALYDNESWNNQRDFAKLVKAISLPQDFPMNKITSSCGIYNGPHDTQYCMENLEQAFVDYASSCTNEAVGIVSNFMASQGARLSKFEADFKQQQSEMTNKIDTVLKANIDRITGALPSDTVKNPILNVNSTSLVLSACSCPTEDPQCSTQIHSSINTITICPECPGKLQNSKPEEEEQEEKDNSENINTDPSLPPDPSISFINEKVYKLNSFFESLGLVPQSYNTEFVCTKGDDGDVMFIEIIKQNGDSHKEEPEVGKNARVGELEMEYFDIFPTRNELAYHKYLMCGPIPSIFLRNPITIEGCPSNLKRLCNIRHVHVEKAYIDLNSPLNIMTRMLYNSIMKRKLDPRENTNGGVNNFTGRIKDLEREHTKSVYFTSEEDKIRGVEYAMSKILGFYKECLELGPEYVTGIADEGEVT